jgi:hypothetical protein
MIVNAIIICPNRKIIVVRTDSSTGNKTMLPVIMNFQIYHLYIFKYGYGLLECHIKDTLSDVE